MALTSTERSHRFRARIRAAKLAAAAERAHLVEIEHLAEIERLRVAQLVAEFIVAHTPPAFPCNGPR